MSKFTRARGAQVQTEAAKQERRYRARRIDEAIARGYERLMDGSYGALGRLCRDIIIPDLGVNRHSLPEDARDVTDRDLVWFHESVRRFVEDPEPYIQAVESETESVSDTLYLRAAGFQRPSERYRNTIYECFQSLESLAVSRGIVSNSVTNWAPAMGYELQIGTWYQPPREDIPSTIQVVDPSDSEAVTVNMGKPGRGKGVAGHTEAEDRYAASRKIIDICDFDECEGAVYDIPQANPTLRAAREEMGLPPDFRGLDNYNPEVEIYVPITAGLADKYIPYHGPGARDTVVRPYTIPAADLSKRALKRFIASELTSTQANIFELAYDEVAREKTDWTLSHLMRRVEDERGTHGNQGAVDRVLRALERIKKQGFISSRSDPRSIDWQHILTKPEIITVFSASLMDDTDEAAKYLIHSYVLYAFRKELKALKSLPAEERERRGFNHLPKFYAILRELHEIAPNSETSSDDSTIREIQEAMTSDFRNLTAMHRHEGVEISADTQNFIGEIKKRARVNFNRACLFSVDYTPAKEMFEELAGESRTQYARTVTRRFGVGECAILGRVGTGRSFEMTIKMAPPMSHHFDPDEWVHPGRKTTLDTEELEERYGRSRDTWMAKGWQPVNSGWDLRVHLLDEEYRPARELLESVDTPEEEDTEELMVQHKRPEHSPGQFAWDCLVVDSDASDPVDRIMYAFDCYCNHRGLSKDYSRASVALQIGNSPLPQRDGGTFGEVYEKRRPVLPDFPDNKRQTAVYYGIGLAPSSDWMECCDNPEFSLVFGPDGTEGYECANCHRQEPDRNPGKEEIECCGSPRPEPIYGENSDEQKGWYCANCAAKTWI